jgi:hypothetical protein
MGVVMSGAVQHHRWHEPSLADALETPDALSVLAGPLRGSA